MYNYERTPIKKTIRISWKEYQKLVDGGQTKHLHDIKSNQAREITIDGEVCSLERYGDEYGYYWESAGGHQLWYYLSENGTKFIVG